VLRFASELRDFNSLIEKTLTPWLSQPSPQASGKQIAAGLAGQSLLEAEGRCCGITAELA
jgi:hypothetical protein